MRPKEPLVKAGTLHTIASAAPTRKVPLEVMPPKSQSKSEESASAMREPTTVTREPPWSDPIRGEKDTRLKRVSIVGEEDTEAPPLKVTATERIPETEGTLQETSREVK